MRNKVIQITEQQKVLATTECEGAHRAGKRLTL
jgi:hypothetical protein